MRCLPVRAKNASFVPFRPGVDEVVQNIPLVLLTLTSSRSQTRGCVPRSSSKGWTLRWKMLAYNSIMGLKQTRHAVFDLTT